MVLMHTKSGQLYGYIGNALKYKKNKAIHYDLVRGLRNFKKLIRSNNLVVLEINDNNIEDLFVREKFKGEIK